MQQSATTRSTSRAWRTSSPRSGRSSPRSPHRLARPVDTGGATRGRQLPLTGRSRRIASEASRGIRGSRPAQPAAAASAGDAVAAQRYRARDRAVGGSGRCQQVSARDTDSGVRRRLRRSGRSRRPQPAPAPAAAPPKTRADTAQCRSRSRFHRLVRWHPRRRSPRRSRSHDAGLDVAAPGGERSRFVHPVDCRAARQDRRTVAVVRVRRATGAEAAGARCCTAIAAPACARSVEPRSTDRGPVAQRSRAGGIRRAGRRRSGRRRAIGARCAGDGPGRGAVAGRHA